MARHGSFGTCTLGVMYGLPIEPMAIAHRGGAALAPENTLVAFQNATSLGFRYLETDVRVTSDGEVVCFHDATLDRVTHGRGRVQRHSLRQLQSLRVHGEAQIPTLAEALHAFPDSNFTIDLKDEAAIEPLAASCVTNLRRHASASPAAGTDGYPGSPASSLVFTRHSGGGPCPPWCGARTRANHFVGALPPRPSPTFRSGSVRFRSSCPVWSLMPTTSACESSSGRSTARH